MAQYPRYANLIIRLFILGLVVFIATTYVPSTQLSTETKLLVSLLVVVTYSVFDLLGYTMTTFKNSLCNTLC